jgi:5'-nucleotidase
MQSETLTYSSKREGPPDLRLLHYNDVYHVSEGSQEPIGGIARFQTLCDYYDKDERFHNLPGLLTLFSGDAFNPSLESSVTKGELEEHSRERYRRLIYHQAVIWCLY